MNEFKKDNTNATQVSESADVSMNAQMDEMVAVLKSIDDKLVSILRVVQEINRRG